MTAYAMDSAGPRCQGCHTPVFDSWDPGHLDNQDKSLFADELCLSCDLFEACFSSDSEVRRSQTEPSPESEKIETSLWTTLLAYYYYRFHNLPHPTLHVICNICGRDLHLPLLQDDTSTNPSFSSHAGTETEHGHDREPLALTSCGHLVGAHCLDQWVATRAQNPKDEDKVPNCPHCRKVFSTKRVRGAEYLSHVLDLLRQDGARLEGVKEQKFEWHEDGDDEDDGGIEDDNENHGDDDPALRDSDHDGNDGHDGIFDIISVGEAMQMIDDFDFSQAWNERL